MKLTDEQIRILENTFEMLLIDYKYDDSGEPVKDSPALAVWDEMRNMMRHAVKEGLNIEIIAVDK